PAPEGLGDGDELSPPGGDAAELLLQRARHARGDRRARAGAREEDRAITTQAAEVQLVERHRPRGGELFLLQGPDPVPRHGREVEGVQLVADRIQGPDGSSVSVLVVTHDEPFREPVQGPGLAGNRSDVPTHEGSPFSFPRWST